MVVQINGKVRDRIEVDAGISAEDAEAVALASGKISSWTEGKAVRKVIARPPKLVNIVVS
jgi:leucyl-tRNA synthetase